jgi:hypothetical protein
MIQVFTDPLLLDFVKVCILMPQDEREQLEAFVGQPYDIDAAAVGNYMVQGPKWVIKDGDRPLVVGGFKQQRPGVWRDYMLTTPEAWEKQYWFAVTRTCRRAMDSMFASGQAHRLECIAPAARLEQRPILKSWYKVMGYHEEGVRYGYCASGADAIAFARVQHGTAPKGVH